MKKLNPFLLLSILVIILLSLRLCNQTPIDYQNELDFYNSQISELHTNNSHLITIINTQTSQIDSLKNVSQKIDTIFKTQIVQLEALSFDQIAFVLSERLKNDCGVNYSPKTQIIALDTFALFRKPEIKCFEGVFLERDYLSNKFANCEQIVSLQSDQILNYGLLVVNKDSEIEIQQEVINLHTDKIKEINKKNKQLKVGIVAIGTVATLLLILK
jgi:hypothetical protein